MSRCATHRSAGAVKRNTRIFILALLLVMATTVGVRAADKSDSNGHLWLNYVGDHPIGDGPWGLHLEGQFRRADFGGNWQQIVIRPGINYTFSPAWSASVGYAYINTFRYGDYPALDSFPEHRIWQQVSYTHKALRLEWQHRVRLEQRLIGELGADSRGGYEVENFRYENRFRYMLRTTIPLTADKKTYLALWDEVFFNFGSNVLGNHFDQNRAFIGIGRKLTATSRLEVGWLEQTLQRRGGAIWENNHTLSVWITSKWPFKK